MDEVKVFFPVESFGHDERSTQFSKGGCCDTLTSSDHKQPIIIAYEKQQEILVFKERAGCPGGGKGILICEDISFTLSTLLDEAICYSAEQAINRVEKDENCGRCSSDAGGVECESAF